MEHSTSSIQTRSRRKRSARLKNIQENSNSESVNEPMCSSKKIQNEIQIENENLQNILDDFAFFISDLNQIGSSRLSSKKFQIDPEPEQYLQKRSDQILNEDNNGKIRLRRSERIRKYQSDKKKQKTKKKEIKKQHKELKVIDEDNFGENEKHITSQNRSLETTKHEANEGNSQTIENIDLDIPHQRMSDDMADQELIDNQQIVYGKEKRGNEKTNGYFQGKYILHEMMNFFVF
jgi:hypothetical protein